MSLVGVIDLEFCLNYIIVCMCMIILYGGVLFWFYMLYFYDFGIMFNIFSVKQKDLGLRGYVLNYKGYINLILIYLKGKIFLIILSVSIFFFVLQGCLNCFFNIIYVGLNI